MQDNGYNTNMKDTLFHLSNEGLEDLESYLLVFLCIDTDSILFLHIWFIASIQRCDP